LQIGHTGGEGPPDGAATGERARQRPSRVASVVRGVPAGLSTSETNIECLNEALSQFFHEVKLKTSSVIFALP
jgi:hypothetical protein